VEDWRIEYNTLRPHSALGYLTPTDDAKAWTKHPTLSQRMNQQPGSSQRRKAGEELWNRRIGSRLQVW
jgi:hypothetical protein